MTIYNQAWWLHAGGLFFPFLCLLCFHKCLLSASQSPECSPESLLTPFLAMKTWDNKNGKQLWKHFVKVHLTLNSSLVFVTQRCQTSCSAEKRHELKVNKCFSVQKYRYCCNVYWLQSHWFTVDLKVNTSSLMIDNLREKQPCDWDLEINKNRRRCIQPNRS